MITAGRYGDALSRVQIVRLETRIDSSRNLHFPDSSARPDTGSQPLTRIIHEPHFIPYWLPFPGKLGKNGISSDQEKSTACARGHFLLSQMGHLMPQEIVDRVSLVLA